MESRTQGSRPRPRTQKKSEAKAKDTKKIRGQGQGQPFRGQTLSRPKTGMLEAKAKDQGHKRAQVLSKKKKVFTKIFQAISTKKRFPKNFSSAPQNFNNSKNSAVLEPRTGQFLRTWGLEAKAKDFKMCPRGLHLWCLLCFVPAALCIIDSGCSLWLLRTTVNPSGIA